MSGPAILPLELYRGDTFAFQVAMWADKDKTVPIDLTGASARAEVSQAGIVMPFVVDIELPNLINVVLPVEDWTLQPGNARWDLQLTYAEGSVNTLLAGAVAIIGDIVQ